MLALKFGSIDQFPFVQAPERRNINDGFRLLEEIGAIGNKRNAHGQAVMTDIGRKLSRLPIDPRYGRMIIEAGHYDSVAEVMVITAGLVFKILGSVHTTKDKLLMLVMRCIWTKIQTSFHYLICGMCLRINNKR